jgi:pSer/pThr/pTyr-binding forkhead associated (FHA) protein
MANDEPKPVLIPPNAGFFERAFAIAKTSAVSPGVATIITSLLPSARDVPVAENVFPTDARVGETTGGPAPAAQPLSHTIKLKLDTTGEVRRLERGSVTIGRDADNDWVPPSADVSRHHCAVFITRRVPTGAALIDLKSVNGTWLDGTRLIPNVPTILPSGAVIRVGDQHLAVTIEGSFTYTPEMNVRGGPDWEEYQVELDKKLGGKSSAGRTSTEPAQAATKQPLPSPPIITVDPTFKLVFLSTLGLTVFASVAWVLAAIFAPPTEATHSVVDGFETLTKIGFGAIVGLISGKAAPPLRPSPRMK